MDQRHRIVVIDDSPTYLKILKTYLEREGYEVHAAGTGEQGLELVGRARPHLILCDFQLPGMKGDEICKQIKLSHASRNIPVIMLTSRGDREDITTGLDAGADDYIIKSQDIDILMLRVRNLLKNAQKAPQASVKEEEPLLHRQKVLTIEDDAFYRVMISTLLFEEGYEVHEANTGEVGLEKVAGTVFDLILVDYIMPGIQGDEVCRRLKNDEKTRDIPVILLTSRGDKKDMIAGLNAGADDYIVKSTDVEVLKSRVKALIRRKYYQDENRRIQEELKSHEIEAARAKLERDLAQEKARLADQLAEKNRSLEEINAKLHETQDQLVQAEKMAALGQLVAGIAHEINNPLAFVYNNLVTIERDAQDLVRGLDAYRNALATSPAAEKMLEMEDDLELATAQKELLQYVADSREGLDRVKNIILNLRNFTRLDEGEVKEVDITEGIESTLKIIAHLMKDRIEVVREYGQIPQVLCYPGLLNQVFMNLLVNATQAIPERGRITIRTWAEGGRVMVSIADTGVGIPPELRQKIFDPFFTTKPVGSGTGLGLSTSYGIMQKHGGRILVESTPGQGSTFTVVLAATLIR